MQVSSTFPPASALTPHAPPMLLVDEVLSADDVVLETRSVISETNPFFVPGRGVPAYVGFEIMAQSISVFDGYNRSLSGEEPKVGFLLGCRKYDAKIDWFAAGDTLTTRVSVLLNEGPMRSFSCEIRSAEEQLLAAGVINVFRPDSLDDFLTSGAAI